MVERPCSFHARKIICRKQLMSGRLSFFRSHQINLRKRTWWSSLRVFFRLSKIEKPLSFLSLDSNKHRKDHMGSNHSFLGFIKNTLRESPEGWAYSSSICYPPQSCVKIKRYSPEMVGKIGKEIFLNLYSMEESLLNMTPFHSLCV